MKVFKLKLQDEVHAALRAVSLASGKPMRVVITDALLRRLVTDATACRLLMGSRDTGNVPGGPHRPGNGPADHRASAPVAN